MPEGGPREPRKIDSIDRNSLAVLGRRIEIWEEVRNSDRPLDERLDVIQSALEKESDALFHAQGQDASAELHALENDIGDLEDFSGTTEDFATFCDEHINYWKEVRALFIEDLRKKGNT